MNRPKELGIEVSLPYADFYFIEALLRLLRPDELARARHDPEEPR
jgi:unsaturated chondroitin disaccharide hydrolase